jgi:hypothetical protein
MMVNKFVLATIMSLAFLSSIRLDEGQLPKTNGIYYVETGPKTMAVTDGLSKNGKQKQVFLWEKIRKYYLKFYDDKTVKAISSDKHPNEVNRIIENDPKFISTGTYQVKNDSIFFTLTGSSTSVKYEGLIHETELHLSLVSSINENRKDFIYTFVEIEF